MKVRKTNRTTNKILTANRAERTENDSDATTDGQQQVVPVSANELIGVKDSKEMTDAAEIDSAAAANNENENFHDLILQVVNNDPHSIESGAAKNAAIVISQNGDLSAIQEVTVVSKNRIHSWVREVL